jgi:hypothetical protein
MIDELYEREYKPRYPQLTRDEVGKLLEASADGSGEPFPDILDKANRLKADIMAEASHLIPQSINGYSIKVSVELEPRYDGRDLSDILSVRFIGSLHCYGHATAFGELHAVSLRDMEDEFAARYMRTMIRETWRHMANCFIETANEYWRKENEQI